MSRKLAETFDTQARLYNTARPQYPDALFETLVKFTSLPMDAALLEIGAGTGQATVPMARRGYRIVALEPGVHLAAVAKQNLASYPNAHVAVQTFEDAQLPPHTFDLVYSATAFHWVRPEVKFTKTRHILKPGGHLAIIHTHHVSDEQGDAYFHASRSIHEKYFPNQAANHSYMPKASAIQPPVFDHALFKPILFTYLPVVIRYSAKRYAELQHTYSPVLALPSHQRHEYLEAVERLIHGSFGGSIDKHFAMSLAIAQAI